MKHLFFVLFIVAGTVQLIAQPNISWERSLGGTSAEIPFCVNQTADGGFIVAGYSLSGGGEVNDNNGGRDIWVVKLDANGTIVWENNYGGTANDEARALEQTSDGGYIIIGSSNSDNFAGVDNYNDFNDIVVLKLDDLGQLQWGKFFGTASNDMGYSIKQTTDSGYIATGYVGAGSHFDAWAAKLDASGNIDSNWSTTVFGGPDYGTAINPRFYSDGFYSVDVASDGYVVSGFTQRENASGNPQNEFWIVKFDMTGTIQWDTVLGGSFSEEAFAIKTCNDGGYVLAGNTSSDDGDITENNGLRDYWIVKLQANGDVEWQKSYGGSQFDEAVSIDQTLDNGFVVLGYAKSNDGDVSSSITPSTNGDKDYWLIKLDSTGNLEWEKSFGGSADDDGFSVKQTSDGGFILAGLTTSSNVDIDPSDRGGSSDFWVVKLEPENLSIASFDNEEGINIYPNPASETIYITTNFSVDIIRVHDILGKVVYTENDIKEIDISTFQQGIYFLEIQSQNSNYIKRIVIK